MIGESDQFSPSAHDNTTLAPPSKDPHYYYQTDIAKRAIEWIKAQKSPIPTSHSSSITPRKACTTGAAPRL